MDNILRWDVDGVTKNLTTLDDFTKITSAMVSATSPTTTEVNRASSHSRPNWITEGDLIRGISSADGNTTTFVDNNYLGIYLGKCTNNQGNTFYGIQIKNKVADTNIETAGGDPPINYNMDFYIGVILDQTNERAFLMYCWDKYNSGSNNYYRVYITTAMYNGTDLLWETFKNGYQEKYTSNGGGATHIAKRTGQLKDLSLYTSDILIVSGGGGGGYLVGENAYAGADAGGISGSGNNSGNQSSGYAFGQGESGTNASGGGSGLYGGTKNGTSSTIIMNSWCKTTDYNNHRQSSHRHNFTVNFNTDVVSELSSYLGSDYILEYLGDNPSGGMYSQVPIAYDGDNNVFYSSVYNKHIALPIKSGIGKIVKLAFTYTNKSSGSYAWIQVGLLKINGSTTTTLKYAQYSSAGNYELTLDTPSEADYLWICNAEDLFEISNMTMYVQASIMNEAGAGSGYIGNSLVNNKKMIGYNVPTSDAEGTKTESINDVSASAVSGKPKSGNGFAKIKFLRDS